jgi:diadenosine tetraphosphate (Ap4A) HIT family hydrolase
MTELAYMQQQRLYERDSEGYRSDCEFCRELEFEQSSFTDIYKDSMKSRVIYRTPNFSIIPTIGQIVKGYSLIISNKHCASIGSLRQEESQELELLMKVLERAFLKAYNKQSIFFEHGVPCDDKNRGGCGITHLHLHAVPLNDNVDLLNEISKDFNFKKIQSFYELRDMIYHDNAYILYINQNKEKFVAEQNNLPSQYMRCALAKIVGEELWDWRCFTLEDRLISSYSELLNAILDDKVSLSKDDIC